MKWNRIYLKLNEHGYHYKFAESNYWYRLCFRLQFWTNLIYNIKPRQINKLREEGDIEKTQTWSVDCLDEPVDWSDPWESRCCILFCCCCWLWICLCWMPSFCSCAWDWFSTANEKLPVEYRVALFDCAKSIKWMRTSGPWCARCWKSDGAEINRLLPIAAEDKWPSDPEFSVIPRKGFPRENSEKRRDF